jgi:putative ABC transport system permease protein
MGILPGVALDELWDVVGAGEQALRAMSALVSLVSLAGLVAVIMAGLNERRRELAILRAVGASPRQLMLLLAAEGALVTLCGVLAGYLAHTLTVLLLGDWSASRWGIALHWQAPGSDEALMLSGILLAGWLASLAPGWRAYRLSLADGLSPRI